MTLTDGKLIAAMADALAAKESLDVAQDKVNNQHGGDRSMLPYEELERAKSYYESCEKHFDDLLDARMLEVINRGNHAGLS